MSSPPSDPPSDPAYVFVCICVCACVCVCVCEQVPGHAYAVLDVREATEEEAGRGTVGRELLAVVEAPPPGASLH